MPVYTVFCPMCKQDLPRTSFYTLTPGKHRATKSGVHTVCRACRKAYNQQYYNAPAPERFCETCAYEKYSESPSKTRCYTCQVGCIGQYEPTDVRYAPMWRKKRSDCGVPRKKQQNPVSV